MFYCNQDTLIICNIKVNIERKEKKINEKPTYKYKYTETKLYAFIKHEKKKRAVTAAVVGIGLL